MRNYYQPNSFSQTAFPISKAGYPFIFALAFITIVFAILGTIFISFIFLFLTLFTCFFFRDPDRLVPISPSAIVSPADGKIIDISIVNNCPCLTGKYRKISIFMSIFNVHVNRAPFEGTVKQIDYYPGKYFSANLDKASKNNERNAILVQTKTGINICFVQIAGLVARRIICSIQPGNLLKKGQRIGLICFGSRLDLYIPLDVNLNVVKGNVVRAGSSIIGELSNVG